MRRLVVALLMLMLASPLPALAGEIPCADGQDNDIDGFTDCADPDCTGIPPC